MKANRFIWQEDDIVFSTEKYNHEHDEHGRFAEGGGAKWVLPDDKSIKQEYMVEYQHHLKPITGDIFPTEQSFVQAIHDAPVVELDRSMDSQISGRTHITTMEGLHSLISGYRSYPKYRNMGTLTALGERVRSGQEVDMPIVTRSRGSMRVLSGNTRSDIGFMHADKIKVVMLDLDKYNKFNPFHDEKGRFAEGPGGGTISSGFPDQGGGSALPSDAKAVQDKLPPGYKIQVAFHQTLTLPEGVTSHEFAVNVGGEKLTGNSLYNGKGGVIGFIQQDTNGNWGAKDAMAFHLGTYYNQQEAANSVMYTAGVEGVGGPPYAEVLTDAPSSPPPPTSNGIKLPNGWKAPFNTGSATYIDEGYNIENDFGVTLGSISHDKDVGAWYAHDMNGSILGDFPDKQSAANSVLGNAGWSSAENVALKLPVGFTQSQEAGDTGYKITSPSGNYVGGLLPKGDNWEATNYAGGHIGTYGSQQEAANALLGTAGFTPENISLAEAAHAANNAHGTTASPVLPVKQYQLPDKWTSEFIPKTSESSDGKQDQFKIYDADHNYKGKGYGVTQEEAIQNWIDNGSGKKYLGQLKEVVLDTPPNLADMPDFRLGTGNVGIEQLGEAGLPPNPKEPTIDAGYNGPAQVHNGGQFSSKESKTIRDYTGSGNHDINHSLRDPTKYPMSKYTQEKVAVLDRVFADTASAEPKTIYRGITERAAAEWRSAVNNNQSYFVDKGFLSTSSNEGTARTWKDGSYLTIKTPAGSPVLDLEKNSLTDHYGEHEWMVGRGQMFHIDKVENLGYNDRTHFFVSLIPKTKTITAPDLFGGETRLAITTAQQSDETILKPDNSPGFDNLYGGYGSGMTKADKSRFGYEEGEVQFLSHDEVQKFNPNHDQLGRFSESDSAGTGAWSQPSAEKFISARDQSKRPQFLSPLKPEDLAGSDLYLSKDGKVGVAVTGGDVGNVFNNGGPHGAAAEAVATAVDHGGRTLDAYDGFLPHYYGQFGFVETGRVKFNPEFAHGWDTAKHDSPDVVFMVWKGYPGGRDASVARASNHIGEIDVPPTFTYYGDWDAAKSASRKDVGL